jgi:hypothetical protein
MNFYVGLPLTMLVIVKKIYTKAFYKETPIEFDKENETAIEKMQVTDHFTRVCRI